MDHWNMHLEHAPRAPHGNCAAHSSRPSALLGNCAAHPCRRNARPENTHARMPPRTPGTVIAVTFVANGLYSARAHPRTHARQTRSPLESRPARRTLRFPTWPPALAPGTVADDFRVRASIPTLAHVLEQVGHKSVRLIR